LHGGSPKNAVHVLESLQRKGALEHFEKQLHAPNRLRRSTKLPGERLFIERFGRAAVRTCAGFLRVRHPASRAMAKETGGLRGRVGRRFDTTENQFLRPDAESIAVFELGRLFDPMTIELHAVSTVQVVKHGAIAIEDDASMMTRDQRVFDRHVAIGASAKDRGSPREVELLKQKPQTVPGQLTCFSRAKKLRVETASWIQPTRRSLTPEYIVRQLVRHSHRRVFFSGLSKRSIPLRSSLGRGVLPLNRP
jgi:hypothetical protein